VKAKHKINPDLIWGEEIGDEIRDAGEMSDRYDAAKIGSSNLLMAIAMYLDSRRRGKAK
jgi:hypothetical protein